MKPRRRRSVTSQRTVRNARTGNNGERAGERTGGRSAIDEICAGHAREKGGKEKGDGLPRSGQVRSQLAGSGAGRGGGVNR